MSSEKELIKEAEDIISSIGDFKKDPIEINDILTELKKFLDYGIPINQAKQTLIKKYKLDIKRIAEELYIELEKQDVDTIKDLDKELEIKYLEKELEKFLEYGVPLNQAKQTIIKKYGINKKIIKEPLKKIKKEIKETKGIDIKKDEKVNKKTKKNKNRGKINKKFYCYFALVFILLYIFTIYLLNSPSSAFKVIWFLIALPIFSGFLFVFITYIYHVTLRLLYLSIPIGIISYIFQVSYISPIFLGTDTLIAIAIIFFVTFLPGAIFAYPISLLISKTEILQDKEISNNILIYKLIEKDEERNRLLFHIIRKNLSDHLNITHYKTISEDNQIYTSKNPLSLKYYFFSFYKDTLIFFPFLKDGYGYYLSDKNEKRNSYIDTYFKNIFNINRIEKDKQEKDVVNNFIGVYNDYCKPPRIISLIKSVRNLPKKISKNDIKILFLISVFFSSLFIIQIPNIFENINYVFSISIIDILSVFGAIGGIIALYYFIEKIIKYFMSSKKENIKKD